MIKIRILITLVFIFIICRAQSQDRLLEKTISVSYGRISKYEALKRIGYELGISFSYKEGLLRNNDIKFIDYRDISVDEVLTDLFEDDALEYIWKDNIVVIRSIAYPDYIEVPLYSLANNIPEPDILKVTSDSLFSIHRIKLKGIGTTFANDSFFWEPELILPITSNTIYYNDQNIELVSNRKKYFQATGFITSSNSTYKHRKSLKLRRSKANMQPVVLLDDEECYDRNEAGGSCEMEPSVIAYKIGISVAPHITFTRNTKTKLAIHGGFIHDIWYKNKIGFNIGLQFSSQQTTIYSEYEESESVPETVTIYYYGIPTCITLSLFTNNVSKHYITGGLYHYLFSNKILPINSAKNIEWLQYINFSYTMEINWFSSFSYYLRPFLRYPLGNSDKYELLTKIGISLGINYTF